MALLMSGRTSVMSAGALTLLADFVALNGTEHLPNSMSAQSQLEKALEIAQNFNKSVSESSLIFSGRGWGYHVNARCFTHRQRKSGTTSAQRKPVKLLPLSKWRNAQRKFGPYFRNPTLMPCRLWTVSVTPQVSETDPAPPIILGTW